MPHFIYVANWKMNVSLRQAEHFYTQYWNQLIQLTKNNNHCIIICPSFVALHIFSKSCITSSHNIFLGAQDCSAYTSGAYTGDIDALSLQQAGCSFCIVGHSERRILHKETNEIVAQKTAQLQLQKITPIVCIGESTQERERGETNEVLKKQLKPILTVTLATEGPLYIAYEPVWAIGSNNRIQKENLAEILDMIDLYIKQFTNTKISLLYGGSVQAAYMTELKTVPLLSGVLVGSASTDFHSLQKIVS